MQPTVKVADNYNLDDIILIYVLKKNKKKLIRCMPHLWKNRGFGTVAAARGAAIL